MFVFLALIAFRDITKASLKLEEDNKIAFWK